MKKILLLNGAKKFAHSDGRYNLTLHDTALAFFDRQGFDVKVTHIDEGYDVADEVEKFLWADVIVYQMPGWWMARHGLLKNTSTKYLPKVTARFTPVTAAPVPMPRNATAAVV